MNSHQSVCNITKYSKNFPCNQIHWLPKYKKKSAAYLYPQLLLFTIYITTNGYINKHVHKNQRNYLYIIFTIFSPKFKIGSHESFSFLLCSLISLLGGAIIPMQMGEYWMCLVQEKWDNYDESSSSSYFQYS